MYDLHVCVFVSSSINFKSIYENKSRHFLFHSIYFLFDLRVRLIDGLGGCDRLTHCICSCLCFALQNKSASRTKMNYSNCLKYFTSRKEKLLLLGIIVVNFIRSRLPHQTGYFDVLYVSNSFFPLLSTSFPFHMFTPGKMHNSKIAYMTNKMYKYPIRINIKPEKKETKQNYFTIVSIGSNRRTYGLATFVYSISWLNSWSTFHISVTAAVLLLLLASV